jgi:hypothetical protein
MKQATVDISQRELEENLSNVTKSFQELSLKYSAEQLGRQGLEKKLKAMYGGIEELQAKYVDKESQGHEAAHQVGYSIISP